MKEDTLTHTLSHPDMHVYALITLFFFQKNKHSQACQLLQTLNLTDLSSFLSSFLHPINTWIHYSTYQSVLLNLRSHKALLSSLFLNQPEVCRHFSILLLCLRRGGTNRNERAQLRGLPFRTHFQLIIMMKLSCFPATVTRYAIQEEHE